jgi:conjugal transfer pilus assembly protein TraV
VQRRYLTVILSLWVGVQGCASWINPYASDFHCPKTENGRCISVPDAYEESLKKDSQYSGKQDDQSGNGSGAYEKELFKKLAGMLKEPVTPMVKPPTAIRVLFTPYPGDENELYLYRYAFFFVDNPSFILGDYLKADMEGEDK